MKMTSLGLTLVMACMSATAYAQWQWVDKDGRKVFSDRAPPSEVQEKSILRRPAGRQPSNPLPTETAGSESAQTATSALATASGPKTTGVDKDLEAKKKMATDAEAVKRKAEEERVTKAKIENCARAKQGKATYDSGVRISRANGTGEREILDDAARAAELKRIQSVIDSDCK
jgi:hypothetical protein